MRMVTKFSRGKEGGSDSDNDEVETKQRKRK